ncbi:hypothetical protein BMS_2800 [Halobacteriovorax marinus SJ]|uniref:Uncharacterized protein n=1 Tax=Halobacteriovorax marinus (strain ATCC BAA-682 / DSM 15412 / SJ) TaxID=862908 RepID=E1WY21_HALMS|nr:hypothetical protein [Halobacteriovorax marinus]CBW27576.1 hypothetical protein BMS_2800 [Halobacteriovorax marinus SJ]
MNRELLNKIDNSITSILWISATEFHNTQNYFEEFNYLMSGILEKKQENLTGLYQTDSFNRPLSIALIKKDTNQSALAAAESSLAIINKESNSKVLIVHENIEDNLKTKFEKKYKGCEFLEFSPTKEDSND